MLAFYFLLLASAYSFLLENPQGNGGTTITHQYLTISKFYEEMKLQQADTTNVRQETIKLRHDTDTSLTLLSSQLQQKFDLLDKKLAEIERQNNSNSDFVNLEHKYILLEQKYSNLEHNYISQGHELAMLKNKSRLLDEKIENLQHFGSIKIVNLQQVVKSISAQTSLLNMKELAHSQNFIDLYSQVQKQEVTNNMSITDLSIQMKTVQTNHNTSIKDLGTEIQTLQTNHNTSNKDLVLQIKTLQTKHNTSIKDLGTKIKTLQTNYNTSIKDLGTQIKTLQTNYNASITGLGTELKSIHKNQSMIFFHIDSKMRAATIRDNQSFIRLQKQIDKSTEQVAMTAHPLSNSNKAGIIKFDNVAFSVGIDNLSTYKSSGKFVCEKEGLYLFSVSIMSTTNNAYFMMYHNNNEISYTYINFNINNPSQLRYTGTAVHALQLRLNDSVWVYYVVPVHVERGFWSTFMVIKIK